MSQNKEATENMQYMKEQVKGKWNKIIKLNKLNKKAERDHGLIST